MQRRHAEELQPLVNLGREDDRVTTGKPFRMGCILAGADFTGRAPHDIENLELPLRSFLAGVGNQVALRQPARIAADGIAGDHTQPAVLESDRHSWRASRAALKGEGDFLPVRGPARRRGGGEVRRQSQDAEAGAIGPNERQARGTRMGQRAARSALCRFAALPAGAAGDRSSRKPDCDRERQARPDRQAASVSISFESSPATGSTPSRPVRGRYRHPRSNNCPMRSPA
jgi:hypothetical protein